MSTTQSLATVRKVFDAVARRDVTTLLSAIRCMRCGSRVTLTA